ncbi:MAG: hypothetical protein ABSB19_04075 [Methylomonas sp.]|jgi:hypothetical protein
MKKPDKHYFAKQFISQSYKTVILIFLYILFSTHSVADTVVTYMKPVTFSDNITCGPSGVANCSLDIPYSFGGGNLVTVPIQYSYSNGSNTQNYPVVSASGNIFVYYQDLAQDSNPNTTFELRNTDCSGSIVTSINVVAGVISVAGDPDYSAFSPASVTLVPGNTYAMCVSYIPQAPELQNWITLNFNLSTDIALTLNTSPPVTSQPSSVAVPATPWQIEVIFAACLVLWGMWVRQKKY